MSLLPFLESILQAFDLILLRFDKFYIYTMRKPKDAECRGRHRVFSVGHSMSSLIRRVYMKTLGVFTALGE
jgi:hypothetical protein